jgi:transposase-like protein
LPGAEVPPQLQAVDAQHGLDGKRRAASERLVCSACIRFDQSHQLAPGRDLVHFFKEDFLARLLGQRIKAEVELVHGRPSSTRVTQRASRGNEGVLQTVPSGKTIVFGLLKRGDSAYTEIVPNACKATLQAIIRGKVDPNSIIDTDGWRGYDGLVDIGLQKHFRVNHGNNEFARGANHVNGIESLWSYAKHRLAQFHGIRNDKFELHLKETEFRFNHRR